MSSSKVGYSSHSDIKTLQIVKTLIGCKDTARDYSEQIKSPVNSPMCSKLIRLCFKSTEIKGDSIIVGIR